MFTQVVGLCVSEGLVHSGVAAIDGTKIEADVSAESSVTRRQIVDEILDEAEAVDTAEDLEYGARRGDELPERWTDLRDRRTRLREALRQLDADGPSSRRRVVGLRQNQIAWYQSQRRIRHGAVDGEVAAEPCRGLYLVCSPQEPMKDSSWMWVLRHDSNDSAGASRAVNRDHHGCTLDYVEDRPEHGHLLIQLASAKIETDLANEGKPLDQSAEPIGIVGAPRS